MRHVLHAKFTQHPYLADQPLATGTQLLIEGNTRGDTSWGVCGGAGHNHLRILLVDLRDQLRKIA